MIAHVPTRVFGPTGMGGVARRVGRRQASILRQSRVITLAVVLQRFQETSDRTPCRAWRWPEGGCDGRDRADAAAGAV